MGVISQSPRSGAVAIEIMTALVVARLHHAVPLPDVMIASIAVVGPTHRPSRR